MMTYIDTHAHVDGEEFNDDREDVIARARQAGCRAILVPAIDLASSRRILQLCQQHPHFLYPMVGLHPEEVRADWQAQLADIKALLPSPSTLDPSPSTQTPIAIGEVGLDYYWSREYEREQLAAFDEQLQWSAGTRLPLMIHCRKAQNEMVRLMRRYERDLPGGVFHCFTGNEHEVAELLQFSNFVLGIGGVFTFKKSHLPEVLPAHVPLTRLVLETDAPYMAPVPIRGKRNESAYVRHIITRLAEAYDVSEEEVAQTTNATACRIFRGVKGE